MSIYKRGEVYWYKFMWQGKLVRESTKRGNDKVARQMEAAHKTSLAKGEVGIVCLLAVSAKHLLGAQIRRIGTIPARTTQLYAEN
jgi:hypothetical protein